MEKIPASVGILTFNSAATLERALESVKDFAEIIVCDGGSTDATLAIAEKYGARVIAQDAQFKNTDGRLRNYGGVRQQMLDAATHEWFLYIDSDETISDGLREDIRRISAIPVRSGEALVYRVPIRIVIDGHEILHSSNYPGYQHRFFNRKSGAHFIKPVHERISFDRIRIPVGTLSHPWYVYATAEESKHYLRETARYRALEIAAGMNRSLGDFLQYDVYRSVRTSLGALLKSTRNYLLYGFKDSAPVEEEMGRVLSPLYYVAGLTRARAARKLRFLKARPAVEAEVRVLPKLLERAPLKAFIDVGANAGAYVSAALKVLPPGKIYAGEPNPEYQSALASFVGVHVEQIAFSSTKGTARLKVPSIKGASYPTRGTLETFTEVGETGAEYYDVETVTLDEFCLVRGLAVGTLKIDVEGHEQAVLEGAKLLLREQHPNLIIEIEQRHHDAPIAETLDAIVAYGYDGYFYDTARTAFAPLSEFSVATHQAIETFKTPRYVNNFVFVPTGAEAPVL